MFSSKEKKFLAVDGDFSRIISVTAVYSPKEYEGMIQWSKQTFGLRPAVINTFLLFLGIKRIDVYITLRLRLGLLLFAFYHVYAYSHCYCIAFIFNKQSIFFYKKPNASCICKSKFLVTWRSLKNWSLYCWPNLDLLVFWLLLAFFSGREVTVMYL